MQQTGWEIVLCISYMVNPSEWVNRSECACMWTAHSPAPTVVWDGSNDQVPRTRTHQYRGENSHQTNAKVQPFLPEWQNASHRNHSVWRWHCWETELHIQEESVSSMWRCGSVWAEVCKYDWGWWHLKKASNMTSCSIYLLKPHLFFLFGKKKVKNGSVVPYHIAPILNLSLREVTAG